MKIIACAAIIAVLVVSVASTVLTSAQSGGPSANGTYRFVLEDELTKSIEFEAHTDGRGVTTGQMIFTDQAGQEEEEEGTGDPRDGSPAEFRLTATFDTMAIDSNRALIGGTITESSHPSYVGRWVQLVVEDGREGPDQLSWRVCKVEEGGWVPVDAEDPRDEGAWWHWWATDAELRDDVGIPSMSVIPGAAKGCPTFPLSAYSFADARGEGQIQVQQ